jgi:hypothetical protein
MTVHYMLHETGCSHSSGNTDFFPLECDILQPQRSVFRFQRHWLAPSTTQMIAAASNSENSIRFYQTALHHTPENSMLNECCCCSLNSATGTNAVKCYTFWGSGEEALKSKRSFYNRFTDRTLLIDTMQCTVKTVNTKCYAMNLQISV